MSISVIIPTYNRKRLLQKTLNSILNQSKKADEIIVVDNLSTDGTYEWLKKQKDKVITIQNKGINSPGAARNLGLSISTGSYVKYFDSDDLMTSNMLETQLKILENTGKGFVYSPYFYAREISEGNWGNKDSVILNYFPIGNRPLYHYMMVYGLFITIPGMLFQRELLKETGTWREDIVSSEDWDYLLRLSLNEPFPAHTNECAFLYRLHGQQTTESNFNPFERDAQKKKMLIDLYNKSIRNNDQLSVYEKLMFSNVLYELYTVNGSKLKDPLNLREYDTLLHRSVWLYKRMIKRIGRFKTQSAWLPCHGPCTSNKKISEYMRMIAFEN